MKPRTCFVQVAIANDKGERAVYGLKPLPPAELAQSVAGFFLTKLTEDPSPVYAVAVEPGGVVSCDCPQHGLTGACKHAEALVAAGVVPTALVSVLREQARLLDGLEEEAKRHSSTVSNLLASVSNLTEKNALLQQLLDEAQDMIMGLEQPKRRPARRQAA